MAYDVGQVLFLIFTKKQRVVPVQVVEQLVRKNLDGIQTSYTVNVPGTSKNVALDELEADVHESITGVRAALEKNAQRVIKIMCDSAQKLATENFDIEPILPEPGVIVPAIPEEDAASKMQVTLDDGTVANVTLPSNV